MILATISQKFPACGGLFIRKTFQNCQNTVRSHQNGNSVKWESEPQKLCKLFAVKWDFSKMGIWSPPDQAHQSKWEHGPYSLKYNTL